MNNSKNEYRILEHQGLFYVQIKVETVVKSDPGINFLRNHFFGIFLLPYCMWLSWKHRNDKPIVNVEWRSATMTHAPIPYKTLEEAKAKIELLNTPDKIHYINEAKKEYPLYYLKTFILPREFPISLSIEEQVKELTGVEINGYDVLMKAMNKEYGIVHLKYDKA